MSEGPAGSRSSRRGASTAAPAKTRWVRAARQASAPRAQRDDAPALDRHAAAEAARIDGAVDEQGRRGAAAAVLGEQALERPAAEAVAIDDEQRARAGEEAGERGQRAAGAEQLGLARSRRSGRRRGPVAERGADRVAQVVEVDRRRLDAARRRRRPRVQAASGRPATGSSGLGRTRVSGRRRSPRPAASTSARVPGERMPLLVGEDHVARRVRVLGDPVLVEHQVALAHRRRRDRSRSAWRPPRPSRPRTRRSRRSGCGRGRSTRRPAATPRGSSGSGAPLVAERAEERERGLGGVVSLNSSSARSLVLPSKLAGPLKVTSAPRPSWRTRRTAPACASSPLRSSSQLSSSAGGAARSASSSSSRPRSDLEIDPGELQLALDRRLRLRSGHPCPAPSRSRKLTTVRIPAW